MLILYVLGFLLIISFFTDLFKRKIYNVITIPAIIIGIGYHFIIDGMNGLLYSSLGLIVGVFILFIPFLLNAIGAGDVKLFGAIGSLMGSTFVLHTFFISSIFALIISFILLMRHKQFLLTLKKWYFFIVYKQNLTALNQRKITCPYAIPIVLGSFSLLCLGGI